MFMTTGATVSNQGFMQNGGGGVEEVRVAH